MGRPRGEGYPFSITQIRALKPFPSTAPAPSPSPNREYIQMPRPYLVLFIHYENNVKFYAAVQLVTFLKGRPHRGIFFRR